MASLVRFLSVAVLALLGVSDIHPAEASADGAPQPTAPDSRLAASGPPLAPPLPDSGLAEAVRDLETGRPWHAARTLRKIVSERQEPDPFTVLLLARAEAGWGHWSAVWDLLSEREWSVGDEPDALWLKGRAAEEEGAWAEAAEAYRRYLEADGAGLTGARPGRARAVEVRRARSLFHAGRGDEALEVLAAIAEDTSSTRGWAALELANAAAESGAVEFTRRVLRWVDRPHASRTWELLPRAHLSAGDTAAALDAYLSVARAGEDGPVAVRAWVRAGDLRLRRGDTATAARAYRAALDRDSGSAEAAWGVVETGAIDTPEIALRAFRALGGSDREAAALEAVERFAELSGSAEGLSPTLRLARARLLVAEGRPAEAIVDLRELASSADGEVAAEALVLWARARRRQGRWGDARRIQDRLVEEQPSSAEAVDVVFHRADDRHDRGDLSGAAAGYRRAIEMAPALNRAGEARMRLGQVHLTRGELVDAAEVFEGYLAAFPRGRRWEEATYWAAWSRAVDGDPEAARAHTDRLMREQPLSYYTVLAGRLLGEAFGPQLPPGAPAPRLPWLEAEMERVEMLREAGLEEAVEARIQALIARVAESDEQLLRLSLELGGRGFTLQGIRLGWELRRRGHPWDHQLVRAIFPFPYRELVAREAAEWNLDPYFLAALIRQESAFEARARSGAGAVGLMQVIPSTGEAVARRVGPARFSERLLEHPEVNVHLGAAFLAGLKDRFGDRTPLVLVAYNAGPTRARRWERAFPEIEDPVRFTERIPFSETRGYVKSVTRNLALYRWLYGEQ